MNELKIGYVLFTELTESHMEKAIIHIAAQLNLNVSKIAVWVITDYYFPDQEYIFFVAGDKDLRIKLK